MSEGQPNTNINQQKVDPLRVAETGTGWSKMKSTSLFRALNFELYIKPNKHVISFGIAALIGCVAYIAYMNFTADKRVNTYIAMNPDGTLTRRVRTSRILLFLYLEWIEIADDLSVSEHGPHDEDDSFHR
ncbi:hypothetical protein CHS0354_036425 [Potamilus streckersoni]|uniref:Small integral membrane protein 8 n=1 Tax=Potamilus streckersoni TaxID=2493646 RepID=A0AAE0SXI5_9BIVA|nr:hypothetical protein CHS0354_036425 [Potamilus streckersoni]